MFFVTEFFHSIVWYEFLKNYWIFLSHGLFYREKILDNSTISIFKKSK